MSEKLLPCPFCGHDTPEFERMGDRRQSCIVICGWCGARHESSDEGDRCGSSWNQRAEPSQDGLRTALETALARIEDMLADDDRQAFKEAREFLDATRPLSATPSAPAAVEPVQRWPVSQDPLTQLQVAAIISDRDTPTGEQSSVVEPRDERAVLSEMIDSYALAFHAAIVRPESHDKMKAKAESIMDAILARASKGTPL